MRRYPRERAFLAFLDLLFILVLLLIMVVNVPKTADTARPIADYTLYVSWDTGRNVDIDVNVLMPTGEVVWFRAKDRVTVTLERDDLGNHGGRSPINLEVVNFRQPPDGEYMVSVHNYRHDGREGGTVVVEMLDRRGRTLFSRTVPIPSNKEEVGIMTFEIVDGKAQRFRQSDQLFMRSWRRVQ